MPRARPLCLPAAPLCSPLTRSLLQEHLHLIVPHRFYVTQQAGGGDRHVYAGRSRFITEAMAEQFERITWPEASQAGATATQPQTPLLQVRSRARAAWR